MSIKDYLKFEDYIHSCDEKEYSRDVRKKNYLVKYVNLLAIDNMDAVSLKKFCMGMLFFKNTFCKESFIEFFLNVFDEDEQKLLANVVFDMFVRSESGHICDEKMFFELSLRLYKLIDRKASLNDNWNVIKAELPST